MLLFHQERTLISALSWLYVTPCSQYVIALDPIFCLCLTLKHKIGSVKQTQMCRTSSHFSFLSMSPGRAEPGVEVGLEAVSLYCGCNQEPESIILWRAREKDRQPSVPQ